MIKLLLCLFLFNIVYTVSAQQRTLVLKRRGKTVQQYWLHSYFAFQTHNNVWRKGELIQLKADSFFIRPTVVKIGMFQNDTLRYPPEGYALSDVLHMPIKGLLIDYKDGKFQVIRSAGNISLYWLKSGLILRMGAIGFTTLTLVNGLMGGSIAGNWWIAATAVYATGFALKRIYKPVFSVKGKYELKVIEY